MANVYRYYEILELRPGASAKAIKQAYRRLVKQWHPDRFAIATGTEQAEAEQRIKAINEAYAYLKDHRVSGQPLGDEMAPRSKVENEAEWYYIKGVEKAKQERYSDAIADFSQAIFLQPDYLAAYKYRALVYAVTGKDRRANADLRRVAQLKKRSQAPTPSPTSAATGRPRPPAVAWSCAGTLRQHRAGVTGLALSPDGRYLVSSSDDATVRMWQLSTGRSLRTLTGHTGQVHCVAVSPDGRWIASGGSDRTVRLWNLQNGRLVRTLGGWFGGHSQGVFAIAFHPDRKRLVSGSADQTVRLWAISSGKELRTLTGYSHTINAVAISPDGLTLVSSSLEKSLKIRQMGTGRLLRALRQEYRMTALLFNADGSRLFIAGSDQQIRVWDVALGMVIQTYTGHTTPISALTLSSDDQCLVSGSEDGMIKVWSVATGQADDTIHGHSDRITGLVLSPDGNTLASSSLDHTIKLWWRSGS
jgi:WD40 repeat protein